MSGFINHKWKRTYKVEQREHITLNWFYSCVNRPLVKVQKLNSVGFFIDKIVISDLRKYFLLLIFKDLFAMLTKFSLFANLISLPQKPLVRPESPPKPWGQPQTFTFGQTRYDNVTDCKSHAPFWPHSSLGSTEIRRIIRFATIKVAKFWQIVIFEILPFFLPVLCHWGHSAFTSSGHRKGKWISL